MMNFYKYSNKKMKAPLKINRAIPIIKEIPPLTYINNKICLWDKIIYQKVTFSRAPYIKRADGPMKNI